MTGRRESLFRQNRQRTQRGAAFLVLVLMIGIAGVAVILSAGASSNPKLNEAQITAKSLATAREALMAYAVSVPDSDRLGDLPCPATSYVTGQTATSCNTSTSRLGYLPWKTLGLPELRDGTGAPLLYAVSNGFKYSSRTGVLNSDTAGEFTVGGENAIAIVFAPGTPIGSQDRAAATFDVTNFLEGGNADGNTVFDNSAESATFNDRLIWITPRAFFPPLEMRALRVAEARLKHYFETTGRYPKSNRYQNDYQCWTNGGRLPYSIPGYPVPGPPTYPPNPCLLGGDGAATNQWTMAWPAWFFPNYWDWVIHYAVAEPCTEVGSPNCSGGGNFLRLNGTDNYRVLLIRQGIPNGQSRPCSSPSQCLDDDENRDSDRDYITPVSGNDRLSVFAP